MQLVHAQSMFTPPWVQTPHSCDRQGPSTPWLPPVSKALLPQWKKKVIDYFLVGRKPFLI